MRPFGDPTKPWMIGISTATSVVYGPSLFDCFMQVAPAARLGYLTDREAESLAMFEYRLGWREGERKAGLR